MTLTPIARSTRAAMGSALQQLGWNSTAADAAAAGMAPVACLISDLSEDAIHSILLEARDNGVEALSGSGWLILNSSAGKMAGMVRSGHSRLQQPLRDRLASLLRTSFEPATTWVTARGTVDLAQGLVVGILNVTPDSFSDGGEYVTPEAALQHVERMVTAGAGMIDVGAESTRPGVEGRLTPDQEWARLEPVLGEIIRQFPGTPVSVDTVNSATARNAIDTGAWAINDVAALRCDPEVAQVCSASGTGLILMHSRGELADLADYRHAVYEAVVNEVVAELSDAIGVALAAGIRECNIVIDPGLGFGKRPEHNLTLLRDLDALLGLGFPIMVGPSRKRFLGEVTGHDVSHRDADTAVACALAYVKGARLFRVHSATEVKDALALAQAIDN